MKKLLVLMLALVMVFSLASCKSKCEKKGHVDSDNDLICDRCEAKISASIADEPENTEHTVHTDTDANGYCDGCNALFISYGDNNVVGTLLRKSLDKQFNELQSVKINLEYETEVLIESWDSYYDYDVEEAITYLETDHEIDTTKVEILVNKTERGFDLKMTTMKSYSYTYGYSDEDELYTDEGEYTEVVYLIDGYIYNMLEDGIYTKSEMQNKELFAILYDLTAAELVPLEKRNEMLDKLGAEVAAVLNLKDGIGSFSVDMADSVNGFFNYLATLDFENDTVAKVVNDALALVSEELTVEELIDELERIGGLTVNEGLAELDAWLTAEHGTTVQGIYDSLVNNADFMEAFQAFFLYVNGLDIEKPDTAEMTAEVMAMVKSFKLADYIEEEEMGDERVYDVVNHLMRESLAPYEELFPAIRNVMSLTLGEFDEEIAGGRLDAICRQMKSVKVDALNAKVDLSFEKVLELAGINGSFNFAFSRTKDSYVEGKVDSLTSRFTAKLSVSNMSTAPIVIALDSDATIVDDRLINGGFYGDDGYVYVYYYESDGDIHVGYDFEYYVPGYDSDVYFTGCLYSIEEAIGDEITVTDVTFYFRGAPLDVDYDAVVRFSLDVENGSVTFLEMPEFVIPNSAYNALMQYNIYGDSYTFDGIEYMGSYGDGVYHLSFTEDYPISAIVFTLENGEDDNTVVCQVVGFEVDSKHAVKFIDRDGSWYGAHTDPDDMYAYFVDPTFTIVFNPDEGTLTIPNMPTIKDEYKDDWE